MEKMERGLSLVYFSVFLVSLWGEQKSFFIFYLSCLDWHVIEQYDCEFSIVQR